MRERVEEAARADRERREREEAARERARDEAAAARQLEDELAALLTLPRARRSEGLDAIGAV
ncbi:MAG: hypothetical protein M5U28_34315 [Sandaracinaceae bacterium]|nr:hypothetical protein [Sandaracinaceae bacterium]